MDQVAELLNYVSVVLVVVVVADAIVAAAVGYFVVYGIVVAIVAYLNLKLLFFRYYFVQTVAVTTLLSVVDLYYYGNFVAELGWYL